MIGLMMMNKIEIYEGLDKIIPNPICELNYSKDYELLIAVMLSAQTTDKGVNEITKILFNKYNTLEKLNKASINDIKSIIRRIGFYNTKAKNLKEIVRILLKYDEFPKERNILENMPGVGRKTASVVLSELFNESCMPVDTHVSRVSKRLGLVNEKDNVVEIENKLCKLFDKDKWNKVHKQLVLFGRYHCTSKSPKCNSCPFQNECKYKKSHQH